MTKQELIERLKNELKNKIGGNWNLGINTAIMFAEQLDEPKECKPIEQTEDNPFVGSDWQDKMSDYTEDYRPVLKWIAREVDDINLYRNAENGFVCTLVNWIDPTNMDYPTTICEGIGDTIGEAICIAAAELYHKSKHL